MRLKNEQAKALEALSEISARIVRLAREDSQLKDRVAEMLRHDVDSLEELEEIKRLKAEAAKRAKSSLPASDPYSFLLDVDFPFDLQTLASLEAPQAS